MFQVPTGFIGANTFGLTKPAINIIEFTIPAGMPGVAVTYIATTNGFPSFAGAPIFSGVFSTTTPTIVLTEGESWQDYGNNSEELSITYRATRLLADQATPTILNLDYTAFLPTLINIPTFAWNLIVCPIADNQEVV